MKTAVILSARKEPDSMIPYPLIPFNGQECLIDRNIGILKELDFTKIIIVCGFRSDLFEPYGHDAVQVVVNGEYAHTASMASLASVRDIIDEDFLLLEGDTFYEKSAIEKMAHVSYPDCLAVTEESGSGDEAYVETYKGFVTKITKDIHQLTHYEGEMLGLMRISLSTYRKMLALWDLSGNLYCNYEYVFMDATSVVDRPYLYFKNLIWGDVDCREDFHKLQNYIYPRLRRKEDPYDHDNLVAHLKYIFPDRDLGGVSITQIGGLSNKNFKVELGKDAYVLRVPGNGSEGMVNRSFEDENSSKGSALGINPPVRYFNRKTGIKLVDFIPGAETLNPGTVQRPDNMMQIAGILKTLHTSNVRLNNDFNVFLEILNYEKLLAACGGKMYEGYAAIRDKVLHLEDILNAYGVELKACHNDMVAENFVKSDSGKIYLIDWEYSGMNDPYWEFAGLFNENNFTPDNRDYFLHCYFPNGIPAHAREKILIYEILMDVLWSLWTCIKEKAGDDFGSYGLDRFSRALENLKLIG